jgi:hypothetical protein
VVQFGGDPAERCARVVQPAEDAQPPPGAQKCRQGYSLSVDGGNLRAGGIDSFGLTLLGNLIERLRLAFRGRPQRLVQDEVFSGFLPQDQVFCGRMKFFAAI